MAQIENRVGPGVKVGGSSESETYVIGVIFSGVVDENDGELETTGEFAKGSEDRRNLGGIVFVYMLQSHIGVEN